MEESPGPVSDIGRARAVINNFIKTVAPEGRLVGTWPSQLWLDVPIRRDFTVSLTIEFRDKGPEFFVGFAKPDYVEPAVDPQTVARAGGMMIQISNLITQIKALAGGVADEQEQPVTAG